MTIQIIVIIKGVMSLNVFSDLLIFTCNMLSGNKNFLCTHMTNHTHTHTHASDLVSTHGDSDVLLADLVMSNVAHVISSQLEDVG